MNTAALDPAFVEPSAKGVSAELPSSYKRAREMFPEQGRFIVSGEGNQVFTEAPNPAWGIREQQGLR